MSRGLLEHAKAVSLPTQENEAHLAERQGQPDARDILTPPSPSSQLHGMANGGDGA